MKVLRRIGLLTVLLSAFAVCASAQLTGTKNVPGNYPTLAAAVTDLNTQGAGAGGVTINLVAGNPQTAPAGGYAITTLTGTAANPIIIQGNGNTITAFTPQASGNLNDAIFKIIGSDFVTITGFTMQENAANTTTAAATNNMTEFGVAVFYASATDGAKNITIQNNTISLNRAYQNTFGIYSTNRSNAASVAAAADITSPGGANDNLHIYTNNISNVNMGIVVIGSLVGNNMATGLDVGGGSAATANSLTNFGTTGTFSNFPSVSGTVNGILVNNNINLNISFNNITSSVGGVTSGTLRGIFTDSTGTLPTTGTISNQINNNSISLKSANATGAMVGILNDAGNLITTLSINNNNFFDTTHTVASSGTITFVSNTADPQNENINSNTFTNLSVNTSGNVTFISSNHTLLANGTQNVIGNSIVTAFNKTVAGGAVTFFNNNGNSPATAVETYTNNNFSNVTVTGATSIGGFNANDGGTPTKTVTGNTFTNFTGGTGGITALVVSSSGSADVSNNTISNVSCACAITGITSTAGTQNFSQNTIHTLATTGANDVNGIVLSGGTTQNVFRNKIYNLSGSNAAGTVNGIVVAGTATTATLFNNLIGDLRTPAANAANPLNGINITGGTTVNVYFNTVFLNATSTAALFGSSAIFASVTPTVTLRNNIFVNNSTPKGTGLSVAHRRSDTGVMTYGNASNNNDFSASTIFFDGTTARNLNQYKNRVSPRDSASFNENPSFLSTNGADASFLHINPAVATQLESGGPPIAGITTDFDNQTRNSSATDVGADEFSGIANDQSAPVITYTTFENTTITNANRTLTVAITDGSGVAAGANAPRLYFRKNTGAYFSTQCALASGNAQVGTYTCTIDYALLGGVAATDVIEYFVVAQDVNGKVDANPNAGFAATNVNNVTTAPTNPNTYTILAPFPTSVNVGTTETITSLTNTGGLFSQLNAGILTSNVTVNITTNLTAETGTVSLRQLTEEGAGGYSVTFQPSGAARVISGTSASALINLSNADRITFSGLPLGGNSLTIRNIGTGATIRLINDASNNSITSCIVEGGGTNTIFLSTGNVTGNDNNVITGNVVRDRTDAVGVPTNGIVSSGDSAAPNSDNSITNNQVLNFTQSGIFIAASTENSTITGNDVSQTAARTTLLSGINFRGLGTNLISQNSVHDLRTSFAGGSGISTAGIFLGDARNTRVSRNRIFNFPAVAAGTGRIIGIEFGGASGAAASVNIENNMVSLVTSVATAQTVFGIADFGFSGNTFTADYNSIYIGGTASGAASSWGLVRGTGIPTTFTARNNIAFNNRTGGTGSHFAGGDESPGQGTFVSNFNFFAGTGATTAANFMELGAAGVSFPTYQAGPPTRDANSVAGVASGFNVGDFFVNADAGDLHLKPTATPVLNAGTALATVTNDFDGETRPATATDIGADEIASGAGALSLSAATYTVGENGGTVTVTVNRAGGTTGAVSVNYTLTDGTATGGAACGGTVDYVNAGGTVNFANGETSKTFTVAICNDTVFEGNETFNVTLSNATGGATIGAPSTAVVTITEDKVSEPGTFQFSSPTFSVGEGGGTATITVNRTGGSNVPVTVSYTITGGSATGGASCATAGVDYITPSGTLTFAPGITSQTIVLTICNDVIFEGDETVNLMLASATNGGTIGAQATAVLTITDDETAQAGTFQFSAPTYSVNEGSPTATITVNRTGGSNVPVTVNYSTTGGTATGATTCAVGVDFVTPSGTLTFGSGVTSQTIVVTICNDTAFEGDETVNFSLTGATNGGTIGAQSTAVLTITDDETAQAGSFQFSAPTYSVDESGPTATITVNRTGGNNVPVTVNYTITGGTAVGGADCNGTADYITPSGTLTFGSGVTSQTIVVTICNDSLDELDETVNFTLNSASNGGTIGAQNTAVLTIVDNDTTGAFQFSSPTYSVSEGSATATITVNRTGNTGGTTATVNYAITGGTATGGASCAAGVDYITPSGTLTFGGGITSQTIVVTICNDTIFEGDETVNFSITSVTNGGTIGTQSTAVLTIIDDESAQAGTFQFSSPTYSIDESGPTATITVNRTGGSNVPVTVNYTINGGTATGGASCATAGVDYITPSGTLTFGVGVTSQTIVITICNDAVNEPNETVNLMLTSATGGGVIGAQNTAVLTIIDNDPAGVLQFSAPTFTVDEGGTGSITVTRTSGSSGTVTVDYATVAGGTATGGAACTAGVDFINTSGTLTFAPGVLSQTISVVTCNDAFDEPNETVNLVLSNPTNGATLGAQSTAVLTITDNDPVPNITISNVTQNEGNSGTTSFVFTVTLSQASGQTVTVMYQTNGGTATPGSDYIAIPPTLLTFNPGETSKQITVTVNGDTTIEPDETFFVELSAPTNATFSGTGLGTIVNDDFPPPGALTIDNVRVQDRGFGTTTATFTVTLTNPNGQTATVQYATSNGTASAGGDYVAASGTLTFSAGQTTQTITVIVNGDDLKEPNETFFVNLSNPINATISDAQGVGIIIDIDRTVVADFDLDLITDFSVYRPSNGFWYVLQSSNLQINSIQFGTSEDIPVPGDYNGDGKADIAIFRPSTATWFTSQNAATNYGAVQYGLGTDKPVQGDYDGDSRTDVAVFRDGGWFARRSMDGVSTSVYFGTTGDIPVQGDYDGDGKTDYAVYRSGAWYVLRSSDNAFFAVNFGIATDKPIVGDFDGDGKSDFTVYRDGVWYVLETLSGNFRVVFFGNATDIPTPGDYDGDATMDISVFRPSAGTFYYLNSSNGSFDFRQWGTDGDIPVPSAYQSRQ